MRTKLLELNKKYTDLLDEINVLKANGSLSKLCNLRSEFDETFDQFFDRRELRVKYDAWDHDEDVICNYSNKDLEDMLDDADLADYIKFYESYIERLGDELNALKSE